MKKLLTIVFCVSLITSIVVLGNVSVLATTINSGPQIGYLKRKTKKVYYRTKRGTKDIAHETKHGTKKTYNKTKRVTKKTYSKTKDKVTS